MILMVLAKARRENQDGTEERMYLPKRDGMGEPKDITGRFLKRNFCYLSISVQGIALPPFSFRFVSHSTFRRG